MASLTHLLIPFAGAGSHDRALPSASPAPLPPLPNLHKLLSRLAPERTIETPLDGPAMPCELALAAELGLPDAPGHTPWAAHESGTIGTPCAFLQLCHWQVGMDQVQLLDPATLALTDDESRALLAAAAPWFAEDGISLSQHRPGVWLAQGECFRDLRTVSLDRVIGRTVSRELMQATGASSTTLQRLQHEMQMLFYDHPCTDARLHRRQLAPNALWITGAGVLAQPASPAPGLRIEARLSAASRYDDSKRLAAAWREVDASSVAELAAQGAKARLTLCGERRAVTFATPTGNWAAQLARRLRPSRQSAASILSSL